MEEVDYVVVSLFYSSSCILQISYSFYSFFIYVFFYEQGEFLKKLFFIGNSFRSCSLYFQGTVHRSVSLSNSLRIFLNLKSSFCLPFLSVHHRHFSAWHTSVLFALSSHHHRFLFYLYIIFNIFFLLVSVWLGVEWKKKNELMLYKSIESTLPTYCQHYISCGYMTLLCL